MVPPDRRESRCRHVTVTYQTDLPWPALDEEQLVGAVYQGLYDLDPEDDGLKL
jgi:hypothetical protein